MRAFPVLLPLALVLAAATASGARADVLELDDGRLVEGVVVRRDDTFVVHSRFGPTEIAASRVKARHEAPDLDAQIRAHLERLGPDDTENRALLARWLVEIGRKEEGLAMAEVVVRRDPENAVAHGVLGHIRHQGVWRTPDEARRAEGLEKHGDRWYTPAEWANVRGEAREKALEAEKRAWRERVAREVNTAVQLMLGPDPALRARGRKTLVALATEYDDPSLVDLARHVDAYVEALDEMRAQVAAAGSMPVGSRGLVTGEFRATVSKLKRPIQTFETSLGSNIGNAPVRIQLPELEVIEVRSAGAIPVVVR